MKRCASCGASFEGQRWQKVCWPCWRKKRDGETAREAYLIGYADGRANAWQPPIDAELLRELVIFCHPDRHDASRFEEANRLTSRLLGLREGKAA
jgi:hypothetical protein